MNKILKVKYLEFYITNVCNLTCDGCNRFNDINFKGWQRWSDYAEIYEKWSKEITMGYYSILGGEPFLNPTFYEWVVGTQELWPGVLCDIGSNGTMISKNKEFYQILLKYRKSLRLLVNCHNEERWQQHEKDIKDFLEPPFIEKVDEPSYRSRLYITDKNHVTVTLSPEWNFNQSSIIINEHTKKLRLHNSDREKAHNVCHNKECHHFEKGELFKCMIPPLVPQIDKQFILELSDEDRKLLYSYQSLKITDSRERKEQFIKDLPNSIPLCKFCPEKMYYKKISSTFKKDNKTESTIHTAGDQH